MKRIMTLGSRLHLSPVELEGLLLAAADDAVPLPLGLPQLQQLPHPVQHVPVVHRRRGGDARRPLRRQGQVGRQRGRHGEHRRHGRGRRQGRREVHGIGPHVRVEDLLDVEGSGGVPGAVVVVVVMVGEPPLVCNHGLDVLKVQCESIIILIGIEIVLISV